MTHPRLASLGMYDQPWLQAANDRLWHWLARHLRDRGIDAVPDTLCRARPLPELWRDPGLLLGQTCGLPFRTSLRDRVRYVATPAYALPATPPGHHRSVVIVRQDAVARSLEDLRGGVLALNDEESNSGMNLLRAALAPVAGGRSFFGRVMLTGAHLVSLAAVAAGEADTAAIDAVSFMLVQRHCPERAAAVRVLATTPSTPGLPLVTSLATPDAEIVVLRQALDDLAREPTLAEARAALQLEGFVQIPPAAYDTLLELGAQAAGLGYPALA